MVPELALTLSQSSPAYSRGYFFVDKLYTSFLTENSQL